MCHANEMKLRVASWVIDVYGVMTLRDTKCKGKVITRKSEKLWEYSIKNNLANCNNKIEVSGWMISYICANFKLHNGMKNGNFYFRTVACRGQVMPGATAWLDAPSQILVLSSGVWWSLLLDIRCLWRHNMTSYSRLQTNVLAKFVDTTCIFRDAGAAVGKQSHRLFGVYPQTKLQTP